MRRAAFWMALAGLFSFGAAEQAAATPQWSAAGTPTTVEVIETGGFLIRLSNGISSACTAGTAIYFYAGQNSVTTDGVKSLLAVATAALLAGKTVTIYYDNATSNCWGKYISMQP